MLTLKKKDIINYKRPISENNKLVKEKTDLYSDEIDKVEQLDELVNGMGAGISGDEKNVNNSEIKTAPQATTDDFTSIAIQPNRYLYNVNSVGGRVSNDESYNLAKSKALKILEQSTSDYNKNDVLDLNELPDNLARKVLDLVDGVKMNNLLNDTTKIEMIINYIKNNLKPNA